MNFSSYFIICSFPHTPSQNHHHLSVLLEWMKPVGGKCKSMTMANLILLFWPPSLPKDSVLIWNAIPPPYNPLLLRERERLCSILVRHLSPRSGLTYPVVERCVKHCWGNILGWFVFAKYLSLLHATRVAHIFISLWGKCFENIWWDNCGWAAFGGCNFGWKVLELLVGTCLGGNDHSREM